VNIQNVKLNVFLFYFVYSKLVVYGFVVAVGFVDLLKNKRI